MLEYTLRTYQSPTRLVQRLGAIRELGTEAGLLGIRRPLLVTDPGVKGAGLPGTALRAATDWWRSGAAARSTPPKGSAWSPRTTAASSTTNGATTRSASAS